MSRSLTFPAVILALGLLSASPVLADWVASGTFQYMDREYDQTGFTGVESPRPCRYVDIEIVDANQGPRTQVIATTATDDQGFFSVLVGDSSVRDVYARAVTSSENTGDLSIDVIDSTSKKALYYAAATGTLDGHSPSVNIDFGTFVIGIGQGGEPFNIFDQMLTGTDYIVHLEGSRPAQHLSTVWGATNGIPGAYYDSGEQRIMLRDSAGYDDTVVLHEMGHFIVDEYSRSDALSGTHTFSICNLDLRLAFEEGFASFWGNSALRYRGMPRSNIYMRSNGGLGPGNLVRYADLEDDQQYLCEGSTSEVNIFTVLWDIVDGPSTPDTTPGVDDAHDALDLPDIEVWEVMTDQIPGAFNTSFEDFWDGWFLPPVQNGHAVELQILAGYVMIEYVEDVFEINDAPGVAAPLTVGALPVHATLFRDPEQDAAGSPDDDYFFFQAAEGEVYIAETLNLLSDGNTRMRIYDTDGITLLASNDNRAIGDDSSMIEWNAPGSGTYYIRIVHSTDIGIYGSYDIRVRSQNPNDGDGDGYEVGADCNDFDPLIHPAAPETCDGADNNCDGEIDEGFDADGDLFKVCGGDCDDLNPMISPGVAEIPENGIDDNCNGRVDEVFRRHNGRHDGHYRDFPKMAYPG